LRHEAIVDGRLLVRLDLDHSLKANSLFLADSVGRSHLANQLLLYESIIIPTKDFGILPILISWLGLGLATHLLKSRAIEFLHLPSMLSYVGNGVGISAFLIKPSDSRSFEWWQTAMFGEAPEAIEIQLRIMCPFIARKARERLVSLVFERTHILQYGNDEFMRAIVHETYTDIMQDQHLSAYAMALAGSPAKLRLQKLPNVDSKTMIVPTHGPIDNPAQLVLRIAETNMSLFAATKVGDTDVLTPIGGDRLLRSKVIRCGASPTAADGLSQILDLVELPDPGVAVTSGEVSVHDIVKIRRGRHSRSFRKWLRTADSTDPRDLERMYVAALGKKSFYESLPTRVLRFAITNAFGLLGFSAGLALSGADSFLVEQWLRGYSPKLFIDQLSRLYPADHTLPAAGELPVPDAG